MFPITQIGQEKIRKKIHSVKDEFDTLPAIIAEAREKGDLKENAEYHAAKERQGMLNAQLIHLNSQVQDAKVIDPSVLPNDTVTFGKKITLENLTSNSEEKFVIVGPAETEFYKDSLSVTSDLAKGLLGQKKGDEVNVVVPSGEKKYKIISVDTLK